MARPTRLRWRLLGWTVAAAAAIAGVAGWLAFFGVYRFAAGPLLGSAPVPSGRLAVRCAADLKWQTIRAETDGPAAIHGCTASTTGPWLLDENHRFPTGVGAIHVLMYALVRSSSRPNWAIDNATRPLNLNARSLTVVHRATGSVARSNIYFWVQVRGGPFGRHSNYYHAQPLGSGPEGRWITSRIDLARLADLRCLGTRWRKYRIYGCDVPADQVLRDVNVDFGFIRFADGADNGTARDSFAIRRIGFD